MQTISTPKATANTSEYSIYRRQQVAKMLAGLIFEHHQNVSVVALQKQIHQELHDCPACLFVGADWQTILEQTSDFLMDKHRLQPSLLKLRFLLKVTKTESLELH